MKKTFIAVLVTSTLLTAPLSAGSLSDPIVVSPIEIMDDAVASSGKPMTIVVLTAIILLAAVY